MIVHVFGNFKVCVALEYGRASQQYVQVHALYFVVNLIMTSTVHVLGNFNVFVALGYGRAPQQYVQVHALYFVFF